jgi:polyhydroxyalkanoate synthesis regulator phasin
MGEERRQILEMLAEGKITSEEAERLLDALEREAPPAEGAETRKARPKYLRVLVDDSSEGTFTKVNVRVPIKLLRAGVRLAALVPPQALDRASVEIRRSGMQIDLARLKAEDIDELVESLDEVSIDVDDAKTKVRVFAE